ncbi:energy-coupling factor transporter ATP-binding protein EcfA2 [Pelomonas saccharophila]|uniref:Energy-coupling factor transporter ATP-binding protein EcfA2 n=1 Tax=Roseateles saccharophilus TaxID=304 RepID=A0ABU1YP76_ROSSA|nr:TniB family NTP-binding protein [Roseateles saccharophilus]MDR7270664.1 energy-coupling factor transporter ATP-binding protein EcfA2 [Roseateles saccharophilus]
MSARELYQDLRRFDEEYIEFAAFRAAADAIRANLEMFREAGLVQHLVVVGESGTGKSTLCRWLAAAYPMQRLTERNVVPVLVVAVPAAATIASMAEAILTSLGDPAPNRGTISEKARRIVKLVHGCKVEIILIDEAQHISDRGQSHTHYMVADWLKVLIDGMGVPTVFLGLPRVETLIQANEQLRRRFSNRLRLSLGQDESRTVREECLELFQSLGQSLPLRLSAEPFPLDDLGVRLYYASDGRIAHIKKLLGGALRLAIEEGHDAIEPFLLERVFTNEVWWEGVGALNPFNEAFTHRRLDRAGEPFEDVRPSQVKQRGR